jgi:hypothetical protein
MPEYDEITNIYNQLSSAEQDIVFIFGGIGKPLGMDSIFVELSVRDDLEYAKDLIRAMRSLVSKGLYEEVIEEETNALVGYKASGDLQDWWEKKFEER